jgi:hypothetical protein
MKKSLYLLLPLIVFTIIACEEEELDSGVSLTGEFVYLEADTFTDEYYSNVRAVFTQNGEYYYHFEKKEVPFKFRNANDTVIVEIIMEPYDEIIPLIYQPLYKIKSIKLDQ